MPKILDMPKLSPTMEEGVLSAWHKNEGDEVAVDDLLADVETDKATMEFRAFDKGTLLKLLVPAGATVKLGQPVAVLGAKGEDISKTVADLAGAGKKTESHAAEPRKADVAPPPSPSPPVPAVGAPPGDADDEGTTKTVLLPPKIASVAAPAPYVAGSSVLDRTEHLATPPASASRGRVVASPYVRKTARELGIDLSGARGSGPGGRVVASDLGALRDGAGSSSGEARPGHSRRALSVPTVFAANGTANALAVVPGLASLAEPEVHPLTMMRKTIARRLTESKQTVPHFYLTIDVDAGALVTLREEINAELRGGGQGGSKTEKADSSAPLKVSLNDLIVKASAVALVRVPACNAQFTPEALLFHRRVDISVAVAVPDGLVTPVVRNADQKTVVAIAAEVRDLAARARAKKLTLEEMTQGTFSISNLGMFGVDAFAAVINPPEGAILAVGQARDEPVVQDGRVVAGKRMSLTLSCDHRVVDGAVGAAFLAELRALLEHPFRILTG